MSNVSGAIKSIQDIMRKDAGVDGDAQRISQMVWLFFLKIYDDREAELELVGEDYTSPIPEHLRWRTWAVDREGMTGDGLLDFVNLQLFPRLKGDLPTIGDVGRRAQIVRSVFEDANNFMKSGTLMRQVINKINEIDFNNTDDRHTFGDIYEQILRDLQSAGNAGEFYTPRALTRFIIDRLNPRLDEVVFDPACGTGGFLACAIDHKRKSVRNHEDEALLQSTIRGVEKKALPHLLCITNMILHGIDTPSGIVHGNTLEKPYREYGERDRVPVIATNPPFGGMEQDGIENNFPATLRTRETADLFMALIIKLLKTGGRAAVVLPDGFLFGEGVKSTLKRSLIEECNLHTIVRLPNQVFAPYTGIKTNILFFTKGTPTKDVWFYEHPYPEGVASYNKTKPIRFEEFEAEREWWGDEADGFRARRETEQAWKISAEDVRARGFNLDLKNPHKINTISDDPVELLQEHAEQQAAAQSIRDKLTSILDEALRCAGVGSDVTALAIEHLELWTGAPGRKSNAGRGGEKKVGVYGVERLRALILDLALRGRLVPQQTEDQPATELLKSIRMERAKLTKSKAIGKGKAFPPVSSEPPYPIPASWVWAQVADIGHDWGSAEPKSDFTYIDVGSIDQRLGLVRSPSILSASEAPSRARKLVQRGTVIYSTVRPYLLNIALVDDDFDPPPIASTAFAIVHPFEGVEARFVFRYLRSLAFVRYVESCQTGIAYPAINDRQFFSAWFPLPPFSEQQRIVAKVDELMALCEALEASLIDAERIRERLADAVVERVTV